MGLWSNFLLVSINYLKILQDSARFCNILQDSARFCKILQHSATFCNIQQHSATFCKNLQDHARICKIDMTIAKMCAGAMLQCLWLLLLKVCSYFHKIEEDNFVAVAATSAFPPFSQTNLQSSTLRKLISTWNESHVTHAGGLRGRKGRVGS